MIENELYAPLAAVTHVLCGVPTAMLPTAALATLSVCTKGCRNAAANELKRRKKAIDDGKYVAKDGTLCEPYLVRIAAKRGRLNVRSLWTYVCESAKRGFAEGALLSVELRNYRERNRLALVSTRSGGANLAALAATIGTAEIARAITDRHKWQPIRWYNHGGGIISWERLESYGDWGDDDESAECYANGLCRYGCVRELERVVVIRSMNDEPDASDWCNFWNVACFCGSSDVFDHIAAFSAKKGCVCKETLRSHLTCGFVPYTESETKYARPQDFQGIVRRLLKVSGLPHDWRDLVRTLGVDTPPPEVITAIEQWIKEHPEQDRD